MMILLALYIFKIHNDITLVSTAALTGLFSEVEGEPSSATDTKLLMDQVKLAALVFTFLGLLLFHYPHVFASPAVINVITWLVYILLLPTAASVLFGSYILNYLKGDTDSNSLLYAGIFDLAAVFGFITRFLVQLIRYALVYAKMVLYMLFMELTYLNPLHIFVYSRPEGTWRNLFTCIYDDICAVISKFFHTVFDIFNIIIVHYTQLGALTLVLC